MMGLIFVLMIWRVTPAWLKMCASSPHPARKPHNYSQIINEIKTLGRKAIPFYGDVSKLPQVEAMVEASVNGLGSLDVMVANAGIAQVQWTMDAKEPDLQRLFEVNFYGVVYSDQVAARQFIKQGSGGKIINAAR